ncbi:cation transport protein-domain-containing protein [Mycena rosella]|uniref:Cation transport protein-domain-containing protein n=1 Tax=Mycena rosella TaxID=1033263 RepID=A0AAD7G5X6_MYCRO|nr:cation transport protein-domain-containing protein [Mycena rosella]
MEKSTDTGPAPQGIFSSISDLVWTHGTFYRLHLTAFTIIPLIAAGIFYACNGRFPVSFLDSLFVWYATVTVGLSTINLSTITAWQQVILYILMLIGDITVVSWIMVLVRKWYFRNVCQYIDYRRSHQPRRSRTAFLQSISGPVAMFKQSEEVPNPTIELIQPTPGPSMNVDTADKPERIGEEEEPVLSDARTFSSSPRAASFLLSPPTQSPRAVGFGLTTSIDLPPRLQTIREGVAFPRRTATVYSSNRKVDPALEKFEGHGGFPGPVTLAKRLFKRGAPTTFRNLERKMTMPYTETVGAKEVPWLSFDGLVVGRNSAFRTESLSDEQLEFIGGVEYRALRLLSYLIPVYFVGTQLFAFLIFGPWLSVTNQYDAVFAAQPKSVKKPWYSLFVVLGAYSGGGCHCGMLPFQGAYPMIFALILRLAIWIWYKIAPPGSETNKTLSFLLQHPRRFPSHQTWFLVICLVSFRCVNTTNRPDIGLPFFEEMTKGPRIVDGLFQGLAVRASGLAIVPLASASPALQFLYVVMMYIAVAMTIRSTNVYESESLGVFEEPPDEEDEEPANLETFEPRERIGRYLLWHLDRQMSIDIWWLVWGVFLVAVIERHNLLDEEKKWFDLFRVVFELVSAFGGIGLSLGFPSDNFSVSYCLTACRVRGRHRGLPVGVERAVTLPRELNTGGQGERDKNSNEPVGAGGDPAVPA